MKGYDVKARKMVEMKDVKVKRYPRSNKGRDVYMLVGKNPTGTHVIYRIISREDSKMYT